MPDVQTCFAGGVVGVRLARYSTTHLAREAIAVQYEGPRFFRNGTRECRLRFGGFEQVLSGLERAAVVVGQYLIALFGAQFSHSSGPLGLVVCHSAQFVGVHHTTQVRKKMGAEFAPCTASDLFVWHIRLV